MIPKVMPKMIILLFVILTTFLVVYQLVSSDVFANAEVWTPLCILDWCQQYKPEVVESVVEESPSLIGNTVTSNDGSTCWEITEKFGSYYYKMLESCGNVEGNNYTIELQDSLSIKDNITTEKETHIFLEDVLRMEDSINV